MDTHNALFYLGLALAYLDSAEAQKTAELQAQNPELITIEAIRTVARQSHLFSPNGGHDIRAALARAKTAVGISRIEIEFDVEDFRQVWQEVVCFAATITIYNVSAIIIERYMKGVKDTPWIYEVWTVLKKMGIKRTEPLFLFYIQGSDYEPKFK